METLYTESLLKNRLVAGESYHHEENKFNALVYTENMRTTVMRTKFYTAAFKPKVHYV